MPLPEVPNTIKFCTIKKLMPPNYKLEDSTIDPITAVLHTIGNSDNDVGGQPCDVNCDD